MTTPAGARSAIESYLSGNSPGSVSPIVAAGIESLAPLGEFLRKDLPIAQTERLEEIYKKILAAAFSAPISGPEARAIARFQKELGFLMKYKSYAVKAATPFGYSIFLQQAREGFSYQCHREHKLEVFHILAIKPGGFVFLCDLKDWERVYEKDSFDRWLGGEKNESYEQFKFSPEPGDVFVISELGVVHTVVGCILEEFATVSTDMVDRLHDQNAGRKIPGEFTRENSERIMRTLEPATRNRLVEGYRKKNIRTIEPEKIEGGERTILCDDFVRAARYVVGAGKQTAPAKEKDRAVILRFFRGQGSVAMADDSERNDPSAKLEFERGDLILIPPGIHYAVRNESDEAAAYCEHCIAPNVALF